MNPYIPFSQSDAYDSAPGMMLQFLRDEMVWLSDMEKPVIATTTMVLPYRLAGVILDARNMVCDGTFTLESIHETTWHLRIEAPYKVGDDVARFSHSVDFTKGEIPEFAEALETFARGALREALKESN